VAVVVTAMMFLSACGGGNGGGGGSSSQVDDATKADVANALGFEEWDRSLIPPDVLDNLENPAHSNRSVGDRLVSYLNGLRNNPSSFSPDFSELYANLAVNSESVNPQQAAGVDGFRAPDAANGYLQLPEIALPTMLTFPQADAFDLSAQFGWYYVSGVATGADGLQYGILLMLLSTPMVPPQQAYAAGMTAVANQVMQLQLAVNKEGSAHYQARPTSISGTTGLLDFATNYFSASMGVNSMQSLQPDSFFPMQVQATGWDFSTESATQLDVNITFPSGSNRVLQGSFGCMPCCGGIGTLYYSVPSLQIGPGSTLTIDGETVELVSGTFWMDHQWGSSGQFNSDVMRAWNNTQVPRPAGWDWFSFNFTQQRKMMAFAPHKPAFSQFYNVSGPTAPGTMTVPISGRYIDATDKAVNVDGTLSVTDWIQSTESPDLDLFHPTGTWYPNGWELNFPMLPPDLQRFRLHPITANGSILFFAAGVEYQEAPVNLINAAGDAVGTGYAEATGYAELVPASISNRLEVANLPDTPSDFEIPGPSQSLVEESAAFVAQPQNQAQLLVKLAECFLSGIDRF
jgi:predicted secreted hydrolase